METISLFQEVPHLASGVRAIWLWTFLAHKRDEGTDAFMSGLEALVKHGGKIHSDSGRRAFTEVRPEFSAESNNQPECSNHNRKCEQGDSESNHARDSMDSVVVPHHCEGST